LAIDEEVLGGGHPSTAAALNNLADLLKAQGDLTGARPLFERSLMIFEKVFGPEHPKANLVRTNLARLFLAEGAATEAFIASETALAALEESLGKNHSWTKGCAHVAGDALAAVGRAGEAASLRARFGIE
jgi:tetratricopeptide (TPR) repeat protein